MPCLASFAPRGLRALALATLAGAALGPAAAEAATTLSTEQRATPVAAWAGTVAWSSYDPAAGSYRLVVSRDGGPPQPLAVAPSPVPFDVDLGTNRSGATYAVYTRCATPGQQIGSRPPARGTDCDIYRLSLATGNEQRLTALSSPSWDEREPTIMRGDIAFIRTERHARVTQDVLRIGNTTRGSRATRALVKVRVRTGGLSSAELSPDRIAYIRSTRGGRQAVHVHTLRSGRDRTVYTARSGGANFANIAGLSVSDTLASFMWARTNQGSGWGNRLVRYTIATGRLAYARGSSRYFASAWAGRALGMAVVVDASGTGTCFGNITDPPQATQCSVRLTGPLRFDAGP